MFAQQYHRILHEIQMIGFHREEKKERQKERKKRRKGFGAGCGDVHGRQGGVF